MRLVKKFYGWPEDAKFLVPEGVREHFQDGIGKRGKDARAQWSKMFAAYSQKYPELASVAPAALACNGASFPEGWDKNLPTFPADAKGVRQRGRSSGKVLKCAGAKYSLADRRFG